MNRLLVVATFVLFSFLVGAAVISMNVFPTTIIKRAFVSVGIPVAPTGPPLDRRFAWNDIEVAGSVDDTSQQGTIKGAAVTYQSPHLQAGITVLDGVFNPYEAEWTMLPIMQNKADRFLGKTVMEIGTGSGIISLYAAKLGAAKVVATDISPAAIKTITMNADALDYASVIQPRLVPLDDMSAYSVIAPDEKFDVIISNPPFALDLDAGANDAVTDTGELGFSIVRGLEDHLNSNGVVILLYDSLFYHQVMAKFARYSGYDVRNHNPNGLYPWAAEALFNSYLKRLLESENVDTNAFQFDYAKDDALKIRFLRNSALRPSDFGFEPLFEPPDRHRYYPGMIVIRHAAE